MNGVSSVPIKNRPRIPTPDVTKEILDRETRFATSVTNMQNQITPGVALMPHQLQSNYPGYPGVDVPVVQVVLSPIQELDGSGSVNNTLHAGQPGTAALAQAVLSPGLGPVLTTTPMAVSHFASMGLAPIANAPLFAHPQTRSPSFIRAFQTEKSQSPTKTLTLTELPHTDEDAERLISSRNSNTSNASVGSDTSNVSKETKESLGSNHSNTTASMSSKKSFESLDNGESGSLKIATSAVVPLSITSDFTNAVATLSSPSSTASLTSGEIRSRKTSAVSQNNATSTGSPKRGEVYV